MCTHAIKKKEIQINGRNLKNNQWIFRKCLLFLQIDVFCCGDVVEAKNSTLETIKHKFFGEEVIIVFVTIECKVHIKR